MAPVGLMAGGAPRLPTEGPATGSAQPQDLSLYFREDPGLTWSGVQWGLWEILGCPRWEGSMLVEAGGPRGKRLAVRLWESHFCRCHFPPAPSKGESTCRCHGSGSQCRGTSVRGSSGSDGGGIALHPSLPPVSDVPPHWLSYPERLTSLGVSMLGPGPRDPLPGPGPPRVHFHSPSINFQLDTDFQIHQRMSAPLQNISVSPAALKIKMEILM